MIEYKIKASVLTFTLLVTLTGSIITLDDWEELDLQQKIEVIEKNVALDEPEKELLVDMLASEEDPQKLQKVFSDKARELRMEAGNVQNPIKQIKFKNAADYFEASLESLRRLDGYEKTMTRQLEKIENGNYSPEILTSARRVVEKMELEYEKEKGELKLFLIQAFLALKAANNAEKILAEQVSQTEQDKPEVSDLGFIGPITLILGLLGSILAAIKLIVDYKKSQVELKLAEMTLEARRK